MDDNPADTPVDDDPADTPVDDPTDNPPVDDNPTDTPVVDDPTDTPVVDEPTETPEEDEDIVFDTSIGKEVSTTASYLEDVPYLLPSDGVRRKKQADRPVSYEGIPQDEDGYYDISTPPFSFYDQYKDGDFAFGWYQSFDNQLNNAKSLKDAAFNTCQSLNEWTNGYLMLFDVNTKKLDFCHQYTSTISSSDGTSRDCLFLSRGDIFKDDNGKINYRFSEVEVDLGITECEPIYHQSNISYREGSYYVCNQCNRGYSVDKDKVISEGMTTLYMDMSNTDVMFELRTQRYFDMPGWSSSVKKKVNDFKNHVAIDYNEASDLFTFYDNDWHSAIKLQSDNATINLYDFEGWDSFFIKSLDWRESNNDYKFTLSNGNANNVPLKPGAFITHFANWDGYDYFIGYPTLEFSSPDYESFATYLDLAGLGYKGEEEAMSLVEQYFAGELTYDLFGKDASDVSDTDVIDFVEAECENYTYPEIEKILNLEANPIPLGTSIVDQLFEVNNGVVFDDETILLSGLDVAVKDNPYLTAGKEYNCSIRLLDADEKPVESIAETSFIYGTDEKVHFQDVSLNDVASKVSKGKYYLAFDFNGYQTLLTFQEDKTKLDFEYHGHEWDLDEEGNYQITISDKTLSIHAKEGRQFLIKVKHEKEIVASDQIVVDEENHTISYYCEKCGETIVFKYLEEEEVPVDPENGGGEEPPADPNQGNSEEPPADPNAGNTEEPPADPNAGNNEEPPADSNQGNNEEPPADSNQGNNEEPPADSNQGSNEEPPADPNQGNNEEPPADPNPGSSTNE